MEGCGDLRGSHRRGVGWLCALGKGENPQRKANLSNENIAGAR